MIPLAERKLTILDDAYAIPVLTSPERRRPAWLSGPVVADLVIVAYGTALGLLGALVQPSATAADGAGGHGLDPMIGYFVAAVFILLSLLIANVGLRELQTFGRSLRKMVACFATALAIFVLLAWSTGTSWGEAKDAVLLWFVVGCGVLAALHGVVARGLRESSLIRELCARHVAIVCGHERTCARFLDLLRTQQDADIRVIGVFRDDADRRSPPARPGRTLDDLLAYARARRIDEIFLALPWHAERRISALIDRLAHVPVDLKLCPDRVGYAQAMVIGERLAGIQVATLHHQPIRDWGRIAKRAIDVVLSALLLVLLALPMAAIALAIRLESPGPALFRQQRQGFDGDVFKLLKFRTMRHDPDAPVVLNLVGVPGDPRVTRIGRWLRRTSLDELPQLLNVLRGEMSLVGPRPNAIAVDNAFLARVQRYAARRRVKPGITGWAQVNGWRGAVDTEEKMVGRVSHDLYYIENWSLGFDVKIIALTVLTGFARENAY